MNSWMSSTNSKLMTVTMHKAWNGRGLLDDYSKSTVSFDQSDNSTQQIRIEMDEFLIMTIVVTAELTLLECLLNFLIQ